VTRFAARSETARTRAATADLWFVASSSTSYLYFNEERQAPGNPSGFALADRRACPSVHSGIYGLEDLAAPEQGRIIEAYPRAEIAYVSGEDDFGVFDSSCAALLQGRHVADRALTYQRYLERVFGPEVRAYQPLVLVPGAAHSTEPILTSPLVTPFLFETPPVAAFSLEPAAGMAPLEVAFDGSASRSFGGREIVAYDWDLGGGETASGPSAARTYDAPGRHAVRLRVTDDGDPAGVRARPQHPRLESLPGGQGRRGPRRA